MSYAEYRSSSTDAPGAPTSYASSWYRALFAHSAVGMALADGSRRLIDCNDAFCSIVGRDRDDVVGRRFPEFDVPGDPDVGGPALETVIAGAPSFSYEKRYLRPDGTTRWVRINLAPLNRAQDLYAGVVEDVSERKQAEAAVLEKTELLARAHEVAKLGTFVIDSSARSMLVSAELARMLAAGDEPFEISVEDYRDTFVHPDDRGWTTRLAESAYCHGEPARWERRLIRRDGAVIWETTHMLFELDEQGRAARVMGVVQDISDRIRLVEELRESRARIVDAVARERLRLERDLHDGAQNRLLAVQLKLARAREDAGSDAVASDLDDIIEDLAAAVEEVRAIGHGIYPRELSDGGLSHALRRLAELSPVAVRPSLAEVGRHAPTVEEAIYFCVREALQNAAKHAGPDPQVTLSLGRDDDGLVFEIADDGSGFDPDEEFGGYGMASMRDRVAAVGGELAITSAPREGSRIRGRVPAV